MFEHEPQTDELNPYPWYDITCGTCYSIIATVQIVPEDKPIEPSKAVELKPVRVNKADVSTGRSAVVEYARHLGTAAECGTTPYRFPIISMICASTADCTMPRVWPHSAQSKRVLTITGDDPRAFWLVEDHARIFEVHASQHPGEERTGGAPRVHYAPLLRSCCAARVPPARSGR